MIFKGLHVLVPIVDQIAYVHSLKEQTVSIPGTNSITSHHVSHACFPLRAKSYFPLRNPLVHARASVFTHSHTFSSYPSLPCSHLSYNTGQGAITKDNVSIMIDGVLYVKIVDPVLIAYLSNHAYMHAQCYIRGARDDVETII